MKSFFAARQPAATSFAAACLVAFLAFLPAQAQPATEPVAQRIARFNQLLAQRLSQGLDPVMIALFWAGSPKGGERTLTYRAGSSENPDTASVVISDEGLPDDSLIGSRLSFSFVRRQGRWTLTAVSEAWRCRRGSDTSSYITGVCP